MFKCLKFIDDMMKQLNEADEMPMEDDAEMGGDDAAMEDPAAEGDMGMEGAEAPAAPAAPAPVSADGTQVKAPMPGTILAVKKAVGDAVKAGEVIVVLEAMKMENDIVAPCDGTVKSINAPKGTTVNTDDVLAVI
jgi:biotin carboxyl carrier protein